MRKLLTEQDVKSAKKNNISRIVIDDDCVVTPAAKDAAKFHHIKIVSQSSVKATSVPNTSDLQKSRPSKVILGCDHGGFELKVVLMEYLTQLGYLTEDMGTYSKDAVDYPDYAHAVAKKVSQNLNMLGIIIDGAGVGSAMAANKVPGIRAAACYDEKVAINSREHNYANVLTLGSSVIDADAAKGIVKTWLETDYGAERHKKRVDKIMKIEREYSK